MSFEVLAGVEIGGDLNGADGFAATSGDGSSIDTTSKLIGSNSFKTDPPNGVPVAESYGYSISSLPIQTHFSLMFVFRFEATFVNANVNLIEFSDGSNDERCLVIGTDNKLSMYDTDSQIGSPSIALTHGQAYPCLYYCDKRTQSTRDMLWLWYSSQWNLVDDVSDNGHDSVDIDTLTLGTKVGKGLPDSGGPVYYDEIGLQDFNTSPNTTPLGSITTKLKMADSANTTSDDDFDTGSGSNPSYTNVDETTKDGDTTYDEGDTDEDYQSYGIADAGSGDTPLAVQIVGNIKTDASGGTTKHKAYIYDGSSRDETGETQTQPTAGYRAIHGTDRGAYKIYNTVNSSSITESAFNDYEAGIHITTLAAGKKVRLTNIGLQYIITGTYALPDDFPDIATLGTPTKMTMGVGI